MTKAFSYLRVSGQSQVDGDGFPRQRAATRKWAAAHHYQIVHEFVEKAVPGATDWDERPAWTAMLEAILRNGVRTIIVEQLTRVARDVGVQENIILDLRKRDIVIVSATEDLDLMSKDPARVAMRQMFGVFSQYEKAMLVAKLRAARERKKAQGERCGSRYFYGQHPARPEEAATLEAMRASKASGATLQAIVDDLNARRVPTRVAGKRWHLKTVARILARQKS